jgi:hypothetical protein
MRSSRTFHLSTVLVAIAAFVLLLLAGSGFAQTPPGTAPACRTPEVEAEIQKLTDEISRFQQTYNSLQQEYSQAAQQVREMVSSGRYRGATPGSPAFDELSAASSKADALFARFVAMSNALHADETKLAALKALPACGQQPVAAPPQPQPNAMTPPPPEAPKPVNPTCRSPDVEARIAWLRAEIDYLTRGIEIYQRALEEYETRYTDIALKNLNDPRLKNIQEDVNDEKRAIKQGDERPSRRSSINCWGCRPAVSRAQE